MRTIDFSPLFRHSVGFDRMQRMLDAATRMDSSANAYPPYNIEQIGENALRITLAVAGFSMDDLNVSVEDNQLVVPRPPGKTGTGMRTGFTCTGGIASRQFQRSFVLAEGIEVKSAAMDNGLLYIELERIVAEPEVRTIKIESGPSGSTGKSPKTIDVKPD